jgi:Tol biopolymer transport system component
VSAFDRFDPLEQRIAAALDDIAAPRRPAYLDDLLRETARTRQRPRWTFPGRWLPVHTTAMARITSPRVPIGYLVLLLLLTVAVVAALAVAGTQRRVPAFGPAANGKLAFADGGEIYVSDSLSATPRAVVTGAPGAAYPAWSLDGRRLLYLQPQGDGFSIHVLDADGSNDRTIVSMAHDPNAVWGPDGNTIAVKDQERGTDWLYLAYADGSPTRPINLGKGTYALGDLAFRPPDGRQLLVRVQLPDTRVGFDVVDVASGTVVRNLGLPSYLTYGQDGDLLAPLWSPDGSRLVYTQIEPAGGQATGSRVRIHIVNGDGSADHGLPVPSDPNVDQGWPVWSPDGQQLLVQQWSVGVDGEAWAAVMPADASASARAVGPRIPDGSSQGLEKWWSPDGKSILMSPINSHALYSIDAVSNTWTQVPWQIGGLPDWQRVAP